MSTRLKNLRIAALATDGVEESELMDPIAAFRKEGAEVSIVSPKPGSIETWKQGNWSRAVPVDVRLEKADVNEFDALFIPGGVINPDRLRMLPDAVDFVKEFHREGKIVAAICHGPWMLVEADIVKGKRVTSWSSLKTDLKNAGADWKDEPVVEDGNLITSRFPDDIPAFNEKIISALAESMVGQGS